MDHGCWNKFGRPLKHALKLLQVLRVLNIDTLQPLLHLLTCVVQSNLGTYAAASLQRDKTKTFCLFNFLSCNTQFLESFEIPMSIPAVHNLVQLEHTFAIMNDIL